MQVKDYFKGIIERDRTLLGKAITLIESSLQNDKKKAFQLIDKCLPLSGNSIRIGISGTPGVGKSTFIESFGLLLTQRKHKIAVITIDPSSSVSKGSILGDKTRMKKLANSKLAFVRSSASNEELGGITRHTKDIITLCEASGFNIILIETVGVGQSETLIYSITDIFIYLTLVDNGDEIQFIKKGILELTDIILINKSDQNQNKANQIKFLLENNIQQKDEHQSIFTCSAINGKNIKTIWKHVKKIYKKRWENGLIKKNRNYQNIFWTKKIIENEFQTILSNNPIIEKEINNLTSLREKNPEKIALKLIRKIIKEDYQ